MRRVLQNREELIESFEAVEENYGWDDVTTKEAHEHMKNLCSHYPWLFKEDLTRELRIVYER